MNGERCVTVDGDADRVIYFYTTEEEGFVMLDGDRIATLSKAFFNFKVLLMTVLLIIFQVAGYIMDLLKEANLDLHIGLVQTAYANGSSTKYITETLVISFCR